MEQEAQLGRVIGQARLEDHDHEREPDQRFQHQVAPRKMSRRLDEDPAELRHRRGKAAFDEVLVREPGQRFIIEEEDRDIAFGMRSEEHTSELKSLMRTSYAVFCLKKKK